MATLLARQVTGGRAIFGYTLEYTHTLKELLLYCRPLHRLMSEAWQMRHQREKPQLFCRFPLLIKE